jgi:urease subunit alpha
MFGAFGQAMTQTSVIFLSQAAVDLGVAEDLGLDRPVVGVKGCRQISKADLKLNTSTPYLEVNPETYEVRADGELLTCEPATVLPMAQRYFLF